MSEPIVAIVFDTNGNISVRAAGDVRVVWVDERQPQDRVFEATSREPVADLLSFVGDSAEWGRSGDDRQKRLEVQIARLAGPGLHLVKKDPAQ